MDSEGHSTYGSSMDLSGHSSAKYFNIFVKIDIVLAIISTIIVTVMCFFVLVGSYSSVFPEELQMELPNATNAEINDAITIVRVYSWILLAAACIGFFIEVYLFILARRGLRKNNYGDCQKWFRIRVGLLVLGCLYFVRSLFKGREMDSDTEISALIFLATSIYRIFELFVSKTFIDILKLQQTGPSYVINPAYTL